MLESGNHRYFHGSGIWLPIGTILRPSPDYEKNWGPTELYPILERYRPATYRRQADSVFMCSDEDLDAAGGGTNWVFVVRPLGPVTRHDLNWGSRICCGISDGEKEPTLLQFARNYWAGTPSYDPLWEYLTPSAEVLSVQPF
jgi:hypothetical protein